jgi:hypothetical protein
MESKPKQRKKQQQLQVDRCSSWAIFCCCAILAFSVVRGAAGLPLGGDEEHEAAAASLDVDAS